MVTSLLEVAKTMNAEVSEEATTLSLLDVAKADAAMSEKPATLVDVAKAEHEARQVGVVATGEQSLQRLAREMEAKERAKTQEQVDTMATAVNTERQAARWKELKAAAREVEDEEEQAVQTLSTSTKTTRSPESVSNRQSAVKPQKEVGGTAKDVLATKEAEEDDEDGYSSFDDDGDGDSDDEKLQLTKEAEGSGDVEPPSVLKTTPSDSKESKELLRAVFHGDKYRVRDLLEDEEEAVDANTADQHGWSALHWAASQNHSELLTLLLQREAQVNVVDHLNGWTALHVAVVREALPCIKLLLAAGADVRIKDAYGDTAVDCLQALRGRKKTAILQLLREFQP